MGRTPGKRDARKRKRNRLIYEVLNEKSRILIKDLSAILGVNPNATTKALQKAFHEGYILAPQVRKRSFANTQEYIYFVTCPYPHRSYKEYSEKTDVSYHAVMVGFANFWVTANEEITIEGKEVVGGPRSDYYVAYAPDHSWEEAMVIMRKKVETFNPKTYEPKGIIKTHWKEYVDWDSEDEAMFREFKYSLRKSLSPIMKNHLISAGKIYEFLGKLPERCTVFTRYFPKSIVSYDPYLFMFETDYEDFIIELFSELPTSSFFFTVSDKLFLYANVDRTSVRKVGLDMWDVSQLHIPLLVDDLLERGILRGAADSIVKYAWQKEL